MGVEVLMLKTKKMINLLLDERYDEGIMSSLMYQPIGVTEFLIRDSGKSGDKRIYEELVRLEKFNNIKL